MSESQPSQASGAEEWQAEPAGLLSSPVESVTQWITNIYRHEPGSSTRQEREEILRRQLISAYGLGDEETGQIESQDALEVESRLRLLGRLASTDTDHVDRARAEDFAYEFAHLVWKDAYAQNREITATRESRENYELALHDPLTGLLNRRGFLEQLEIMTIRAEAGLLDGLALLYLDIDRFKNANDQLGHQEGDMLLIGVANVIRNNTRKPSSGRDADVVGRNATEEDRERARDEDIPEAEAVRLGGDEFIILIPYAHEPTTHPSRGPEALTPPNIEERTILISERLETKIREYLLRQTRGLVPDIGVSIGFVLWEPGMDDAALLRIGDMSMYHVKRQRRGEVS